MFGTFGIMYLMVEHNNDKYKSFMSWLNRYKLLSYCCCCKTLVQYAMNDTDEIPPSRDNTSNATSNEVTPSNISNMTPSAGSHCNIDIDKDNIETKDEETIETKTAHPVLFNHTSSVNSNDVDPSFNEYTQTT